MFIFRTLVHKQGFCIVYLRLIFCWFVVISLLISCAGRPLNPEKPHHTKKGFRNLYPNKEHTLLDFLTWRWQRFWKKIPSSESYHFPLGVNDPSFLKTHRDKNTLTWIGHATVLLQINGKNILTDPHFSARASPVQWAGPKRVVPPGIALDDLPRIDVVVFSHDHYDSLDKQTIKNLYQRKGGGQTIFFVPLGLKGWFHALGISNVIELDWWEEHKQDGLKIIATPMQHWGKRSLFSRNNHLWASWIVISENFRFYFGGDTGYSPHFRDIGQRYGPFDLSTLPIGAYEPRWFMKDHHINPEEAVQAHLDLRANQTVAVHWGTFMLTDEPLDEPPKRLREALKDRGLSPADFLVLKHGETIILR
jgi:L-ascorbate metabolism protein UlaG (beta-lactamase superfamily)